MDDELRYRCGPTDDDDFLIVPPAEDVHIRTAAEMADMAAEDECGDDSSMDERKEPPSIDGGSGGEASRTDVRVRGETIMIMSPEEMRSTRTLNYHYTAAGVDARNGLNDARGGANLYADTCETCSLDAEHCKGTHFGTIEHAQPRILQTDSNTIERILTTVCSACSQPAIDTCSYVSELDVMYGVPSDAQMYFLSDEAHVRIQTAFHTQPLYFEEQEPAYPRRLPLWVSSDRDTLEHKLTVLHIQQTQLAKKLALGEMEHIVLYPQRFESQWIDQNRSWLAFLEDPLKRADFLVDNGCAMTQMMAQTLCSSDGGGASDMTLSRQLMLVQKALFLHHRELARIDGFLILLPVNLLQMSRKLRDEYDLATLTLKGHQSALATFHFNVDEQSGKKYTRLQNDVQRLEACLPDLRARLSAAQEVEAEVRKEIARRRWIYARTLDYYRNRGQLHTIFRSEITRRLIAYYTVVGGDTRNPATRATACTFKSVNTKFNALYKPPPNSFKIGNTQEILSSEESKVEDVPSRVNVRRTILVHNQDTGTTHRQVRDTTKAAAKAPKVNKRKLQQQQEAESSLAILRAEEEAEAAEDEAKRRDGLAAVQPTTMTLVATAVVGVVAMEDVEESKESESSPSAVAESYSSSSHEPYLTDVGGGGGGGGGGGWGCITTPEMEVFAQEFARIGMDEAYWGPSALPHVMSLNGFLHHLPYQREIPDSEYTVFWFSGSYTQGRLVECGKHATNKYYAGTWENEKRYRLRNEYDLDHALLGHVYRKRLEQEFAHGTDAFIQYQRTIVNSSSKETQRFHEVPHNAFVGIPHYTGHSSSKQHLSILRCCMGAGGCGSDVFQIRVVSPQNAFQFIAEHPSRFTNTRFIMDHVVRNQSFEFFSHRILCLLKHIPRDHAYRLGFRESRPEWLVRVASIVPSHRLRPQTENAEFKPFWTRQYAKILAHEEDISVITNEYMMLTGRAYFYGAIHEARFPFERTYFFIDRDKFVSIEACACVGDISATLVHIARWVDPKKTTQQPDFKKLVQFATHATHVASLHQSQLLLDRDGRDVADAIRLSPDAHLAFQFLTRSQHTTAFEYRLPKTAKMGRGAAATAAAAAVTTAHVFGPSDNQRAFLKDQCFYVAGFEPLTSVEEKYLVKNTEKIFTHTLALKPHLNGDNANVAAFVDGKFGFIQRHSYTKRTKYTSRRVLLSAPYTSPMSVLSSKRFRRLQVSLHRITTAAQCAFWKHRTRVSFFRSMHLAHRKARCMERMGSTGAPLSQLDYQRYPDMTAGNVYPRVHTITDTERNNDTRDFMTPERILSKLNMGVGGPGGGPTQTHQFSGNEVPTMNVDGIRASDWVKMEQLLAECEAQGGHEDDFWNALAYAVAPATDDDDERSHGPMEGGMLPLYSTSVRHMQSLLTPSTRAKMEREASMITPDTTVDYSLVPGDVTITGRNPTLHRFNLMAGRLCDGDVGYGVGMNGMKYPAFNADNDGDLVHDVIPQTVGARIEALNIMSPAHAALNVQNGSNVDGLVGDALLSLFVISKSASMYVSEAVFLNFVRRIQLIRLDYLHDPRPEQPPLDPSQFDGEGDERASAPSNSPTRSTDRDGNVSMQSQGGGGTAGLHHANYTYSLHEIHNAALWKHLDHGPVATQMHATHESFCASGTRHHVYACPQPLRSSTCKDGFPFTVAIPPPRKPHIRAYHLQQLVDVCLPRDFCFVGGNELRIENGCVSAQARLCSKKYFGISDETVWKSMHIRYDPAYVMQIKFELQSVMFDVMRFFQFAHTPTQLQLPIQIRERMNRRIDQFRRDEAVQVKALNDEFKESFDAVVNAPHRTHTLHDLHFTQSVKRSFSARVELMFNEQTAARSAFIEATLKTWMTQTVDHFFATHPFYFIDLLAQPETVAFLHRPDAAQIDPEVCRWLRIEDDGPVQIAADQFQVPLMFLYIMSGVKGKVIDWANISYALGMQTMDDQLIRRTVEGRIQSSTEFGNLELEHNGFIQVGLMTGMLTRDMMWHAQNSRAKNAASSLLISKPGEMNNVLGSMLGSLSALEDGSVMSEAGHLVQPLCGRGLLNAEVLYTREFPVDQWVAKLDRVAYPRFVHHVTQAVRTCLGLLTTDERLHKTTDDQQAEYVAIQTMRERWVEVGVGGSAPPAPMDMPFGDITCVDGSGRALLSLCARAVDRWTNRTMVSEIRTFKTPFNMGELISITKQRFVDTHYVAPLSEDVFDVSHRGSNCDEDDYDMVPPPPLVDDITQDPLRELLVEHPDPSDTSYAWNASDSLTPAVVSEQVDELVQFMHHITRHVESSGETPHQYPFVDQETFVREHLCYVQVREHHRLTRMQLCLLIRRMKRRFVDALVAPGTATGAQAKDATAEPLTQLMLRVFHFVDKLQQHGGVDHLRALIQLSVKAGGFFVEIALREVRDCCAPFFTPITEDMTDDALQARFAQHSIMDLVHDISNVVSRCYVPRHSGVARILSERRMMDVDQYGPIVQYVTMPTSLSRHNMPNEYQAFHELQRDYHIPDEACRMVLSQRRFQRANVTITQFIERFCMELLSVFRVEIWRHQHAVDAHVAPPARLQPLPTGDTTYVLYIRYLAPIRLPAGSSKIVPRMDQHPMQIYSALDGERPAGGISHSLPAVSAEEAAAALDAAEYEALRAAANQRGPRTMEQAFSIDRPLDGAAPNEPSLSTATSVRPNTSTIISHPIESTLSSRPVATPPSTRGRGRPRSVHPAVRKPRKAATSPKPRKPAKEKVPKNPKRTKISRHILQPIIEADDDDDSACGAAAPHAASGAAASGSGAAAPHAASSRAAIAEAKEEDDEEQIVNGPDLACGVGGTGTKPAACGAAAPQAPQALPQAPPQYLPPIFPFSETRLSHWPDMLTSTPLDGNMGISMHRAHSDVFNTPLFTQDHVLRTLGSVLPHTSISTIQLIRKKTAGSKDATSPFSELDRTVLRFRVNASITSVKLLAFLARPEFDQRFIHVRDPVTMHRFWGITAFYNSLVDEITRTLQAAVDIDLGVPDIIAAMMSHRGYPMKMSPSGATDSGQNHTQRSLVRSSYKIMIRAAQRGEKAEFNSVLSAVAVGNRIPLGTGTVDILRSKDSKAVTHREQVQRKKDAIEQRARTDAFQFLAGGGGGGGRVAAPPSNSTRR